MKELFFKSFKEECNPSEEQLLKSEQAVKNYTIEIIIKISAYEDSLSIIEFFIKNGGDPHLVIADDIFLAYPSGKVQNILNIAAKGNSLNIMKYLLDNNIFTVDQRASENSITPLHSAIEDHRIEAAKLLLTRGANINAEYFKYNRDSLLKNLCMVSNGMEIKHLEMAKFLVKHGVQISDDLNSLFTQFQITMYHISDVIKDFLLSIKNLENLHTTGQKSDFDNAYKALDAETQEIWDVRKSRENLKKIANFIEEKFSKETVIKYEKYQHLRKYSSLSKHKKDALEIFSINQNFSELITKADNFINNNFLEIAMVAKNSAFGGLDLTIIPQITQYLQFEDSSIKIAGANLDDNA